MNSTIFFDLFRLHWVFVVHGRPLVRVSQGYSVASVTHGLLIAVISLIA